ncbi:unnamed protein product [Heterobilharzia americana]|nr:unnamed protein product [Heterobilharzia americana]
MGSEAVKVVVRCRPLNKREKSLNCSSVLEIFNDTGQCSIIHPSNKNLPPKNFFFDGSYDHNSTTEQIYNDICYSVVEGVTQGYNGTIFAYGQTGCGKSYTMQGISEPYAQRGVIPRAFDQIFETISVSEKTKYLVHASFLEIYNEEIRDLLGRDHKAKLELKENPDKGVYVAGLSIHKITCVKDCQNIMETGWKNRSTGATLMNADSSRSHSIFTIYLEMIDQNENLSDDNHIRAGKLNLVDLAGSERQTKTGVSGDRFKEATKINLSLSALGNVISALVDSKVKHIPYRDSKLTRLLQDIFIRQSTFPCLSPADNNYDETLSTLRYANRAKNIQNKPKINEDPKDALLRQYQDEIKRLKELLNNRQLTPTTFKVFNIKENIEVQDIEVEKEKLRQDYETKLKVMEAQYSAEAADKAKILADMTRLREFYDAKISELNTHHGSLPTTDQFLDDNRDKTNRMIDYTCSSTYDTVKPPSNTDTLKTNTVEDDQTESLFESKMNPIQTQTLSQDKSNVFLDSFSEKLTEDELLKRLKLLEADIVGGEQAERRRRLAEANADLEDDGIMIDIYETIQDELHYKSKALQRQKQKVYALQMEIKDIQSEFEQDRNDYLETIRRQQHQINLLNMILDKIQPCIRRNCNYHDIDKIKRTAKFDLEKNEWILPPMTVERLQLPSTNLDDISIQSNSNQTNFYDNPERNMIAKDLEWGNEEDSRLYAKLASRTQFQNNYFTNRRASQLLLNSVTNKSDFTKYRCLNNNVTNPMSYSYGEIANNSEFASISSCDTEPSLNPYMNSLEDANRKPKKLNLMSEVPFNSANNYGQLRQSQDRVQK